MQKIIFNWIKKNTQVSALFVLIILVVVTTSYYNHSKKITEKNIDNLLNNIYLEKTLGHLFDILEPRFKKINHKISSGETLRKILENYSVQNSEIGILTKKLSNNTN